MLFSHDTEHSLACAVDRGRVHQVDGADEGLPDLTDVVPVHEVVQRGQVGRLTTADLRGVAEVPDAASAATVVNRLVSQAGVTPRLTDHDDYDWHIHYFTPGASLADHLAIDCGMALAHVVAAGETERLRVCEAPDCDQVLVDLSRNRSKRYCDARTCGNRLHVAAYRERQRATH